MSDNDSWTGPDTTTPIARPPRVTVASLIEKLRDLPRDHKVYVMDAPDTGDQQLCILDVYEWDGCAVIGVDTNNDRVDNGMGYAR